ncbi:MAG TPA: OmpA family protein [Aquabacterium sp.]|uniref:peptidoglycan-associated lipoprotein n=1 Tax=Aquabacterium sp. TaxID=1872578 RepID=UPI002D97547E|nr:OmpA family protein [Aquabacterium sp.]HET6789645.1 OmpA family protein [Aquabacterium sp.]HEX5371820.1 OmpA family protein [Aquabacterium sp.]
MNTVTSLSTPTRRLARQALVTTLLGSALWLTGCGSTVKLDEPKAEAPSASSTTMSSSSSSTPASTVAPVVTAPAAATPAVANLPTVIYFDFDSFVVKDEFRPTIEGYAKVLTATKGKRMTIEGHTDERGGREYNLALGQKRAEATVKSLTLLGVSPDQLEAVSFGEERPAAEGSTEEAWGKNRRAEFKGR